MYPFLTKESVKNKSATSVEFWPMVFYYNTQTIPRKTSLSAETGGQPRDPRPLQVSMGPGERLL